MRKVFVHVDLKEMKKNDKITNILVYIICAYTEFDMCV